MGASRKLQGEIDRVLKKVQEGVDIFDSIWNKVYDTDNANQKEKFEADLKKEIKKLQRYRDQIKTWIQSSEIKDKKVGTSYEQALMDARKIIEKEMERFKICEKETKTKAFSKEGLGQQPKTDPKEKAKSETRDWLNNVVGELECQIDNFEAELEGLSVRKGKTKPPRLAHLETSITRHKAHIMKLELILRLLDNDELSTEQVNDVKDFLEDYVERNQEDFDEFSDIDELYNSLSLDNVESLEDLIAFGPPGILKASSTSTPPHSALVEDQVQSSNSSVSNLDIVLKTPPSKGAALSASASLMTLPGILETPIPSNISTENSSTTTGTPVSSPLALKIPFEMTVCTAGSPSNTISNTAKDDDSSSPSVPRTPQTPADHGNKKGVGIAVQTSQSSSTVTVGSAAVTFTGASVPSLITDTPKKNRLGCEDKLGNSGVVQQLASPYAGSRQLMSPTLNITEGGSSVEALSTGDSIGRSAFSPPLASNMQWRPGSGFQNKNELFRTRTEIAPDQREKFLQRFQQIQQQGHTVLGGISPFAAANSLPFSPQKKSPILQQFNSQTGHVSPAHPGLGFGVSTSAPIDVTNISSMVTKQQQPVLIMPNSPQQGTPFATQKDNDVAPAKYEEEQPQTSTHDSNSDSLSVTHLGMTIMNDEDIKSSYVMDLHKAGPSPTVNDAIQTSGDGADPLPARLLQQTPLSSGNLGAISRRSMSDIGAVGDSLAGPNVISAPTVTHDLSYNLQMLDTAFCKLPLPKDSERVKNYVPRHPAITPPSYPQTPASIVNNPAFWARLGLDIWGTDTLFYAFYHQQNTYQQYMAAKELKKQSWRFHKKYNTWFQRHEEPKVATDEFEQGTYVYFDFHISNDDPQSGWCQRIKPDFTFEYNHLEDELML